MREVLMELGVARALSAHVVDDDGCIDRQGHTVSTSIPRDPGQDVLVCAERATGDQLEAILMQLHDGTTRRVARGPGEVQTKKTGGAGSTTHVHSFQRRIRPATT